MPRSGGTYSLPAGTLQSPGDTIESADHNAFANDVATALTGSVPVDGSKAMSANLPLGGNKLTNVAAGTATSDGVRYDQVFAGVLTKSDDYTIQASDRGKLVSFDASGAARTATLPAAASAGNGWWVAILKSDSGSNAVTVDGDGSETINGETTHGLTAQYECIIVKSDGSNWLIFAKAIVSDGEITTAKLADDAVTTAKIADDAVTTAKINDDAVTVAKIDFEATTGELTSATDGKFPDSETVWNELGGALEAKQSASGSTVSFGSISSNAKRITVHFDQISVDNSGDNGLLVQIGDSGGFETSGYASVAGISSGGNARATTESTGFGVARSNTNASLSVSGIMTLEHMGGNRWVASHSAGDSGNGEFLVGGGTRALSGALDRVRIATSGGASFDNGSVNIRVEYGA